MKLAVKTENLRFSYADGREILAGVDMEIAVGEAVVLNGLSGSGKTTLCRCLCGIIPNCVKGNLSGRVTVDGCDVSAMPLYDCARHIALVFQNPDDQLICRCVEDELAFALENLCVPPDDIRRRVDAMLSDFGIASLALRDPANLSGGQKKLVTICSVLIMEPQIIILDEPMTGLDGENRALVLRAIDTLRAQGRTVIAVEHDLSLAPYADRILYLREGRLYDRAE